VVDAALTASRALVAMSARSLAAVEGEVTLPQYRTLVVLQSRGPQTLHELAAELRVVPSTATRMCDRLVAKGLVDRAVPEDDRRLVHLSATTEGSDLVARVTAVRRAEMAAAVQAMPAEQRRALVPALEAFAEAAGEVPDRAWDLGWA
jgi:DNA-binding MarR family transcriptional regulator